MQSKHGWPFRVTKINIPSSVYRQIVRLSECCRRMPPVAIQLLHPNSSVRNGVKGDRRPGGSGAERDCPVPHIRGEQNKPSRYGLDRAAHSLHGGLERRFSELDPALLDRSVQNNVGDRHIIAGTDPAPRVNMVGVEAAIMK